MTRSHLSLLRERWQDDAWLYAATSHRSKARSERTCCRIACSNTTKRLTMCPHSDFGVAQTRSLPVLRWPDSKEGNNQAACARVFIPACGRHSMKQVGNVTSVEECFSIRLFFSACGEEAGQWKQGATWWLVVHGRAC